MSIQHGQQCLRPLLLLLRALCVRRSSDALFVQSGSGDCTADCRELNQQLLRRKTCASRRRKVAARSSILPEQMRLEGPWLVDRQKRRRHLRRRRHRMVCGGCFEHRWLANNAATPRAFHEVHGDEGVSVSFCYSVGYSPEFHPTTTRCTSLRV